MELKLPITGIDQDTVARLLLSTALGIDPLVDIPVAAALAGFSTPELLAKIREGTYPTPVQTGLRKRALYLSQVRAWNENPTPALRRTPKAAPAGAESTAGSCA